MDKMIKYERRQLPRGVHLTVEKHTVSGGHPQHWHGYFEIEIILSGAGKYIVNDVEYDISESAVFFLTPTDFHYLNVDGTAELINVSFDNDMLDDTDSTMLFLGKMPKAYVFASEEYDRLANASELLRYECEIIGECRKNLLQYLIKCLLRNGGNDLSRELNFEHSQGVKKALFYMEMHFTEKITLKTVAAQAGYNPTYFSEIFAKLTGETYTETLNRLRLSHAKNMLAGGYSVSDACFLSGFGSLSNFLEVFKKNCNVSPGQYRKSCRF